jgi:pimeloyl-ACP methyl ester carboxylesterase
LEVALWILLKAALVVGLIFLLAIFGFLFEIYKQKTRGYAPGKLISIGGRRLHLITLGEGEPSVIWEAGGGISSIATRSIQKEISKFTRICVYDRAGYGWSDPVDKARSFDDLSSDLESMLEHSGMPAPYILIGESMGGLMVRHFVSRNPSSVAALVLLDSAEEQHTFHRLKILRKMQKGARITALLARVGLIRTLLNLFPSKLGIPSDISPIYRKSLIDDVARASNFIASANELEAYFSAPPRMRSAGGFGNIGNIPLIVVSRGKKLTGAQSFLENGWHEAQERLTKLSSNSKLITAEDSGHAISIEARDLVIKIVQDLVNDYNTGLIVEPT